MTRKLTDITRETRALFAATIKPKQMEGKQRKYLLFNIFKPQEP